ncbi:MAG: Stp1/IreP family PP2C-type Ser/Thr phosphatase [Chlamydiales bacterium]
MIQPTSVIECVGISDIGLIRDHNEDVWKAYPNLGFFTLADGMGGHAAGEVAADESVSYLYRLVEKWHPSKESAPEKTVDFFYHALIEVNNAIYEKGRQESACAGMGTTICALYIDEIYATFAHVGDSRIYHLREGVLRQLTEDHSLVSNLIALGTLKDDERATSPYKHILTSAIGIHPHVKPRVNYLKIDFQDCFLICSDGLNNHVDDNTIESILNKNIPLSVRAQLLVDLAKEGGGRDNITVILVKINDDLPRQ